MNGWRLRERAVALLGLLAALSTMASTAHGQSVFINEIHYDNVSTDSGEAVEIAGPAGTDLSGWKIVRYNGSTATAATVYTSPAATETFPSGTVIPDLCGGFGVVVITYPQDGLQNGPTDGLALVNASGAVVQVLSYEGQLTASTGPAAGMTSADIGVAESASTPVGSSLQLGGSGTTYADFQWTAAAPHTFGACNADQDFGDGDVPPTVSQTSPADGAVGVVPDVTITVAFSEAVTTSASAFEIACGGGSVSFRLGGGPQTYSLTPVTLLPGLTTCTVTVLAAGVSDQDEPIQPLEADVAFSFTTVVDFDACGDAATPIHAIQGSGSTSPMAGQTAVIEGIVVADFQGTDKLSGFYVQQDQSQWDGDPTTSEGIFVFDGSFGVAVQPGDRVRVRGQVLEFGSAGATLTELSPVTNVAVCSSGHAFPRTTITLPVSSPTEWERYEGMAVQIAGPLTVTETFNLGSFGEVVLAVDRLASPTNRVDPGAPALALQALNDRSRIIVDDGSNKSRNTLDPTPYPEHGGLAAGDPDRTVRVGDRLGTLVEGVLDQRFGSYRIQPTAALQFNPPDNERQDAPAAVGGRVRVASFNVLNYFTTLDTGAPICGPSGDIGCRGANTAEEFTRQRDKVISAIAAMNGHVVGLIELENNPIDSIQDLVDGLNAAVPGRYAFIDTGTIGTDAIRVALIYQPAIVSPVGAFSVLDGSVDPRAITTLNRPALAQTFERVGPRASFQRFTVVINHFKSKSSACTTAQNPGELTDPDTGDGQGNCNLTRVSMAQALIDWLASNPTGDPTPASKRRVLVTGDLNAYAREHPIRALTDPAFSVPGFAANANATYTNLIDAFVGADAYSYVFQGQSGYLDHALANQALLPFVKGVTEWHINADEPVALDYNLEWTASVLKNPNQQETLYAPDPFRSSDHDPLIVGLSPGGTHIDGATVYLGLRNGDDISTAFDLRIALESAGSPLGDGELSCVRNILRDPGRVTSRTIPLDVELIPGATVTVRLLARIGTNADGTRCTGGGATHASAGGLRFYYDAATRRSLLSSDSGPTHFHSNGTACSASASTGVSSRTIDTSPVGGAARCQDSPAVTFAGGNAWRQIGGNWTLTVP